MTGIDGPRIEAAVTELLAAIGEDPSRAELAGTPSRVADAYREFFAGVGVDPQQHLKELMPVPPGDPAELVVLRASAFRSICEHHLLPFIGVAHIAYLPGDHLVGLGKLARVLDTIASRPQLQEKLGDQVADALVAGLEPRGVLVVLDAVHQCVSARGVRQVQSSTVTLTARGELADPARRAEVIALIGSAATPA